MQTEEIQEAAQKCVKTEKFVINWVWDWDSMGRHKLVNMVNETTNTEYATNERQKAGRNFIE